MKKLVCLVICLMLSSCSVRKEHLSNMLLTVSVNRIAYSKGNDLPVVLFDKLQEIDQIISILGKSYRTPVKFIIREEIRLITEKEVLTIGMSEHSLNVDGVTHRLRDEEYTMLRTILENPTAYPIK